MKTTSKTIHPRRRLSRLRLAAASMLVIAAAALAAKALQPPKLPWAVPTVTFGNPGDGTNGVAVDSATNTIYVTSSSSDGVSKIGVIDGSKCNEDNASRCSVIAAMTIAGSIIQIVFDPTTSTLYAPVFFRFDSDPNNTIAVFNTKTCTAKNVSGCGQTPATTTVPGTIFDPDNGVLAALTLDAVTQSLYVGDGDEGQVKIVNTASCNGSNALGCSQPAVVASTNGDAVTIDPIMGNVYVSDFLGQIVSVFDGNTCSAANSHNCSQPPSTAFAVSGLPAGPGVMDPATHSFYLPLGSAIDFERLPGQLAVINTLTCNAATSTGCATFATLPGPSGPDGVALFDAQTKTVYVLSFQDNFIAMFDGSTCNAISPSGCGQKFRALATGEIPNFFALNLSTHTFYATSQDTNSVWVIDQSKCNAKNTSGCTAFARATSAGDGTIYTAANANTKTVYVANFLDNTVSVIDSNVCNKGYTAGCNQSWPTIAVGNFPRFVAINKTTNTIYVSNAVDGTLSLINAATCTGTAHSGCVQLATTTVGNRPEQVAIDEATNTIYVGNIRAGTVSVINGAHCQSGDITHCGDSWPTVTVGNSPQGLGINPINHTVYVANTGDNTVSVINGNVCNGSNTSGCATATVATVPVGNAPRSIGVVTATNTLFVGNSDDLTVSVIDGSSCNGTTTFGCPQIPPPTVLVGAFPASASFGDNILGRSIAVDQKKQIVFIPVVGDDDIAELDGHACRAGHLDACHVKIVNQRMGGFAVTAAIDDSSGTVYVGNDNDSTVSLFGVHDQDED